MHNNTLIIKIRIEYRKHLLIRSLNEVRTVHQFHSYGPETSKIFEVKFLKCTVLLTMTLTK